MFFQGGGDVTEMHSSGMYTMRGAGTCSCSAQMIQLWTLAQTSEVFIAEIFLGHPENMFFYYLKKYFSDQNIQK